ncbi:MAG: TonB-dependent receptor [Bryobacteraceae bacterium]|nr:TonB-dependent receptor [Bryobacteraceae bacterium]
MSLSSRLSKSLLPRLASLLLSGSLAFAQGNASLRGTISDSVSAVIPEAVVSVTQQETKLTRQVLSDGQGTYQFAQLPPGPYLLRVEREGFRVSTQEITLQVNTPATADVKLELGAVTETVNVMAEGSTINTVDATLGNPFTQAQVRGLPLETRNIVKLLSIQPGVTPEGEVLGARRDQNNVTLDGVDVNDNQNAGIGNINNQAGNGSNANGVPRGEGFNAVLPVPIDSVQEFRVTIAGQGANFGRSSGGQVALVTKSGSNQFHGSAYEFHRNTATSANNWFNNRAGNPREPLVRNIFGASLGGRIIKDRVFFFGNFEQRIDASGRLERRTVPTETMKQGIVQFRQSDGTIGSLSPSEVRQIDPLGLGYSDAMRQLLSAYPVGNDPLGGADRGLNFSGFVFNAPFRQDDKAYVMKMDFNIDSAGKHTASVRGTLADRSQDSVLAQFPGQAPAAKLLDNSKGISGRYTAVVSPTVVNVVTLGFTRLGLEQAGTAGNRLQLDSISDPLNYFNEARGFVRHMPSYNLVNDTTWMKGKHSFNFGVDFRFIRNERSSFVNSFANFGFSRNTLRGLGADIVDNVNAHIQQRSGNSALRVTEAANVARALGGIYGLVNQYSATYNFGRDGAAVPLGQAVPRRFATNEYEFYLQDSWKTTQSLTLTLGLRYSNFAVPYETNGVQVAPTVGVDQYFAERVGASAVGAPGFSMPNASLTYALSGPVNGGQGWYKRDTNNWSPRVGFAFNPNWDGKAGSIFGKGSVIRGGAALLYDRYGNDLIVEFDRTGSPGLQQQVSQPRNTNFTDSARYPNLPSLGTPATGAFPFTPSTILGGFGSGVGISPDLAAPYSMVLNATYSRPLPGGLTVEVGYIGRLMRKTLLQSDYFQPLTRFRDPASGQTWAEAAGQLRSLFDQGVDPKQVKSNPGLIPQVAFFENMFPGLSNLFFPGSASANWFDLAYGQYAGSELDALNDVDRERSYGPNCISRFGCNTFFANQNAGLRTWINGGNGSFHGGALTVRRALSKGFSFDLNYTWSHAIDITSAPEAGSGNGGAAVQDAFDPSAFRGSSDFDIRHNLTANSVVQLPFGKGRRFLGNAGGALNQALGGWELSMIARYRSGLPTAITHGAVWPTNYLNSALGILASGATNPQAGVGFDQTGSPSIYRNTSAVNSFVAQYPGGTGTRAIARLAPMTNVDLGLFKRFFLPFEGHTLQFRAEAFNAFNNVNFFDPSLRIDTPSTFGQFRRAMPARVMQFALRYEF